MVVLQGAAHQEGHALVYEGSDEIIREYMLRTGKRLFDFFKTLPGLDFSTEITSEAFGEAVRALPGLEAASDVEIDATWKRLCAHTGVKRRLPDSGLREHVRRTGKRAVDLFASLDLESRVGGVTRDDFGRAVRLLGFVDATEAEVDEAWEQLDADGDGRLELGELDRRLMNTRWSGTAVPDKEEGADIYGQRTFEAHKPKVYAWQKSLDALFVQPGFSSESLVNYLKLTGKRVSDFFHSLDADSSRAVSKAEFSRAVRRIGFANATDAEISATWDLLDDNGDEVLEMQELTDKLMKAFRVKPTPKPTVKGVLAQLVRMPGSASEKHWDAKSRTYKSSFDIKLPQRPPNYGGTPCSPAPQPGSKAFERSNAQVLGPGSYDPTFMTGPAADAKVGPDSGLSWVRDPARRHTPFVNTSPQRGGAPGGGAEKPPLTADVELAHAADLEMTSSSRSLNSMLYSTSPGAFGSSWGGTPRSPPFFHVKQRPYCITHGGEPRDRDEGLDHLGLGLHE